MDLKFYNSYFSYFPLCFTHKIKELRKAYQLHNVRCTFIHLTKKYEVDIVGEPKDTLRQS